MVSIYEAIQINSLLFVKNQIDAVFSFSTSRRENLTQIELICEM